MKNITTNSTGNTSTPTNVSTSGPSQSFENNNAVNVNIRNAFNYTGEAGVRSMDTGQAKWVNLLIGLSSAIIICLAVGIGLYFLIKYHRKKILEGLKLTTEGGIVTTFGAVSHN